MIYTLLNIGYNGMDNIKKEQFFNLGELYDS